MDRPKAKARSVGLDTMRFLAVMMVLYTHANMWASTRKFFLAKVGVLYDTLYDVRVASWVGVDLFFVLSGFLVSGLLFQELARTGSYSVGRFLVRRGFKIYPPFWLMLLVTVLVKWCLNQPVSLKALFTELFFLQNYVLGPPPTYIPSFWGITWTLAVEEHFYFLLAGVFYLLKRRAGANHPNFHVLPKLFLCVGIGCLLARLITCLTVPLEPQTRDLFMYATHVRMDALFFGVLLSYYWHNRWDEKFKAKLLSKRWLFAIAGVALLFPAVYPNELWFIVIGFVSAYLGAGYLLISFLSLDRSPCNVCIRAMAWLGRHSYSVYLWHICASTWLLQFITFKAHTIVGWTANLFIYFAMCWTVGVGMSWLVEFPMLRVRDRWFPWVGGRGVGSLVRTAPANEERVAS